MTSSTLFAQWVIQNVRPFGFDLYSSYFQTKEIGYVCGYNSKIYKTTNGGLNWMPVFTSTLSSKFIFLGADSTGTIIASSDKEIIRSQDEGINWQNITPSLSGNISQFFMLNSTNWWILLSTYQRKLLKTTDAGNSWFCPLSDSLDKVGEEIYFTTPLIGWTYRNTGYIYNRACIIKETTDGGKTWQNISTIEDGYGKKFMFVSKEIGFILISSQTSLVPGLYKTTDGGNSWNRVESYTSTPSAFLAIDSLNYIISSPCEISKTTDGGNSWVHTEIIHTDGFLNISKTDSALFVCGSSGRMFSSSDLGNSWSELSFGYTGYFHDGHFSDERNGWVVGSICYFGDYHVLRTTNGGNNWKLKKISQTGVLSLKSIFAINKNTALGCSYEGKVIKTTDGGDTWYTVPTGTNVTLSKVFFRDSLNGWITGFYGTILRTTDGGESWVKTEHNLGTLQTVFFINKNVGWVGSDNLYYTQNGGQNWYLSQNISETVTDIQFIDSLKGWCSTRTGVYQSNNGGISWVKIMNMPEIAVSVKFFDAMTGYVIDYLGSLYKTTNGGGSWSFQGNLGYRPEAFNFYNPQIGWVINYSGRIWGMGIKPDYTVLDEAVTDIPKDLFLTQNFPNPFNPTTKIRYSIPQNESLPASLKVYNLMGEEVITIFNEVKQAGDYEIEFDASSLPSGVYFYQLRVKDFIETKKMLLIK